MPASEDRYSSFLLRLWLLERDGSVVWRASLDDLSTGERRGFTSAEALMDFLNAQMETGQCKDQSDPIHQEKERRLT